MKGKTEIDREQEIAEERAALLSKSPAKINPLRGGTKHPVERKKKPLAPTFPKMMQPRMSKSQMFKRDEKVGLAFSPLVHVHKSILGSPARDTRV